jgi:hypothetical protein
MTDLRLLRPMAALCLFVSATPALSDADASASPLAFSQADAGSQPAAADRPAARPEALSSTSTSPRAASGSGGGGIVKQTPSVAIGCLKPGLVTILRRASAHYGDEVIVTSGFRGGRGRSYHARCMAADVQIAGISPGALARWFRSQPDVGGVGTYGHTRSVHVDVAPRKFSWHGRSARRVRTAEACPCCGGTPHGARSTFACERGVDGPPIRLGAARV